MCASLLLHDAFFLGGAGLPYIQPDSLTILTRDDPEPPPPRFFVFFVSFRDSSDFFQKIQKSITLLILRSIFAVLKLYVLSLYAQILILVSLILVRVLFFGS